MKSRILPHILFGLVLTLFYGCSKDSTTTDANGNLTSSVKDVDGNTYKTVVIGTQTWMAENLKTTKYNDGTAIPLVTINAAWETLSTPAFCWYDNAESNKSTYGALYNWFVVNSGKLAPSGWHVPTDAEFATLITYLGGETLASDKLRQEGTSLWLGPNIGATNSSGFTALPGGYRELDLNKLPFHGIGTQGCWWSSSENSTSAAGNLSLVNNSYFRVKAIRKVDGFSVRCIKN